jgi:hypothetical protein
MASPPSSTESEERWDIRARPHHALLFENRPTRRVTRSVYVGSFESVPKAQAWVRGTEEGTPPSQALSAFRPGWRHRRDGARGRNKLPGKKLLAEEVDMLMALSLDE